MKPVVLSGVAKGATIAKVSGVGYRVSGKGPESGVGSLESGKTGTDGPTGRKRLDTNPVPPDVWRFTDHRRLATGH
jgi:hypothetical protein